MTDLLERTMSAAHLRSLSAFGRRMLVDCRNYLPGILELYIHDKFRG